MNYKNIRLGTLLFIVLALLFGSTFGQKLYTNTDKVLMKALTDELDRSIEKLKSEDLEAAYFISYGLNDSKRLSIGGSFGSILYISDTPTRELSIDIRIGDYELDNSNFGDARTASRILTRGVGYERDVTIEDDYNAIRRDIWLITDSEFKNAHEVFNSKKAALEVAAEKKEKPDMTKEEPHTYSEPPLEWDIDSVLWKEHVKNVSMVLKSYPYIRNSEVKFLSGYRRQYIVNSEGTRIIKNNITSLFIISATVQTENGVLLTDNRSFNWIDPADFPLETELMAAADDLALYLKELSEADTIDYYIGPILFEGSASAEIWLAMVGEKVSAQEMPMISDESMKTTLQALMPETFASRIGQVILPKNISVYNDPTVTKINNVKLLGSYKFDNEGIPSRKTELIDKGKVTGMLLHRKPFKDWDKSTGSARIGHLGVFSMPYIGNLFIKSDKNVEHKQQLKQLKNLCKKQGLDKGYIVRRIFRPLTPSELTQSLKSTFMAYSRGQKKEFAALPIEIYEVDIKTGKEKLVRDTKFSNLGTRSLRDIVSTSSKSGIYNINVMQNFLILPISIIAPDVLFEEVEIVHNPGQKEKEPILTSPMFGD